MAACLNQKKASEKEEKDQIMHGHLQVDLSEFVLCITIYNLEQQATVKDILTLWFVYFSC